MDWLDYIDQSHPSVVAFSDWLSTLLPPVQTVLLGQIEALTDLAAEGALIYDPDAENNPKALLVPIRKQPEIFELRWKLLTKQVRQYHAEPVMRPDVLAALHIHIKTSNPPQKQEVATAVSRHAIAETVGWT
jgi:hypothetical protein